MKVVLLHNADPDSWVLMPQVLDRIRRFCREYESVADPEFLCQQVMNHFAVGAPNVAVFAILSEEGLVGHVLADTSVWAGSSWATILQYETDSAQSEVDRQQGWRVVEAWARTIRIYENGRPPRRVDGLQVFARNPVLARTFRRYGLREDAVLMRKPLGVAPEGEFAPRETVQRPTIPTGV